MDIDRILARGVEGLVSGLVAGVLGELQPAARSTSPPPPPAPAPAARPARAARQPKYQPGSDPVYEVGLNLAKFPRGVEFNKFVRHSGWPAAEVRWALGVLKRRGQAGCTHDHVRGQEFWYPL